MSFYQTLLSIVVKHDYYSSRVCSCLEFHPTNATQRVFENAGLLLKKTGSGIQLAYDVSRVEALKLYAEDTEEPLCFVFKVYSNDPNFKGFTEPFSAKDSDILYFDNRLATESNKYCLSISNPVSSKDFKQIKLFKSRSTYKLDTEEEKEEEQDIDNLEHILSPEDYLSPPEFVLRIFAGNHKGSLLKQWLGPAPPDYSIHFNSRQRYWKYYLLGKLVGDDAAKNNFEIIEKTGRVKFQSPENNILADRSLAYTFRSKQPIPLKDSYRTDDYLNDKHQYQFQLIRDGKVDSPVIERLPVASIKQVGSEVVENQKEIVSEIYINS